MRSFAALLLILNLFVGCARNAPFTVTVISRQWLEIKIALLSGKDHAGIQTLLDGFSASLDGFFASPIGRMYQIQPFDRTFRMESFSADLGAIIAALKTAVQNGEQDTALILVADIDAALEHLRHLDSMAANSVQTAYFRLFFFFSALIIAVILLIAMMRRRMEKALSRERQSRSFSRETAIAQEQERSRIARELHDSVAQDLWRLSLHTGGIANARTEDERRRLCTEAVRGHQALLEQIRNICDDLVPPDFTRQGLPTALRRLCHDFERRSGIECRISIQENLRLAPLDPQLQLQCFRLVQEALANIEKHSGSAEAVVVARNSSAGNIDALLICVSDGGRGFAIPGNDFRQFAEEGRFGIWSMHERAAIVNGTLTIDSEYGEGATVTFLVPLESPDNKPAVMDGGGGG